MGKIGKISPLKKEYSGAYKETLAGSLANHGYSRFPGTGIRLVPSKDINGEYRTGLNPNALYIKQLEKSNPEEAAQEKARVTELLEDLQNATGLDLGPRSDYYYKMFDAEYGSPTRARVVKLNDRVNSFNLDNPQDAITFAWLRVHNDIAPSYQAYRDGKVKNSQEVKFFVDDVEFEAEIQYSEKLKINKAIAVLTEMHPERQFKVARLLGLPVRADDKPSTIYNTIDTFIKATPKNGNSLHNVGLFNKIIELSDENFAVRFAVEEGLKYNIYRTKGARIYEGETTIAKDKEELIANLSTKNNQEDLLALEEKIRQRRLQEMS